MGNGWVTKMTFTTFGWVFVVWSVEWRSFWCDSGTVMIFSSRLMTIGARALLMRLIFWKGETTLKNRCFCLIILSNINKKTNKHELYKSEVYFLWQKKEGRKETIYDQKEHNYTVTTLSYIHSFRSITALLKTYSCILHQKSDSIIKKINTFRKQEHEWEF